MTKLPVVFISGWAHGVEAVNPLALGVSDSHPSLSFSLANLLRQGNEAETKGQGNAASAISAYARATVRYLERSVEPACLVGWSTGGTVAIEAAANCPDKVAGLVLLSTTASFCSGEEYPPGVDPVALGAMIRKLKRNPEALIADFFSKAAFPLAIPEDELVRRTQNALKQGRDVLVNGLEYLARIDLRDCLRTITIPCLVIHGQRDVIVPWKAAEFLLSNLPLCQADLLPSAGHMLVEQCSSYINHRIWQFLEFLQ